MLKKFFFTTYLYTGRRHFYFVHTVQNSYSFCTYVKVCFVLTNSYYAYMIYIIYIYTHTHTYICIYIYIYICTYIQGNHENEKTFLLKMFRRMFSAVKIFCSDTPNIYVYIYTLYNIYIIYILHIYIYIYIYMSV